MSTKTALWTLGLVWLLAQALTFVNEVIWLTRSGETHRPIIIRVVDEKKQD